MRTNNGIISNNRSKDLMTLYMSRAKLFTPVYMLFLLFAKNCGYFYRHYSHMPLHSTNDGLRKSIGVLHARCFLLFTSTTSPVPQKSNAFFPAIVSDLHISERTVTELFEEVRVYSKHSSTNYDAVLGVSFLIYWMLQVQFIICNANRRRSFAYSVT